ncbi:cohesin complex subunit SA-1/2 [Cryptococcus neoformans Bt120]|nr:cohesin complex subunit SA-1/2 [Cryptococcus neoformans var. grubii Bt120]
MSSPEPEEPRRGSRVRKQVNKFDASQQNGKGKRKHVEDQEDDDQEGLISDPEDESDHEPAPKKKKPAAPRKSRASAGTTKKSGPKAKTKPAAEGVREITEKTDSPLFNALQQPDIALQPLIDEWIETYQQAAGDETSEQKSIHELVVFFIRCCGMATEIEQAEATDDDGIPDVIERVQDESVHVALATYPLISKAKNFKPFHSNLNEFISHFISSLALTPILFHTADNTPHSSLLIPLLLNWLMCMSSSTLRPIRHTSTYMTLRINSALCDVAADVSKDLSVKQRQRDAEVRKAGVTNAAQKRVKAAEDRVKEVQERKQTLEELMQEIFDVMFVHRVRDADPNIRTDCLRELGVWAKKYPDYYVSTSYLSYFTRGCNDTHTHARLETVKALANLYSRETFINNARTLTMRLAPRVTEMATRDVDLSVRVVALQVITLIDRTGILQDEEDEERDKVAKLVYDQEPRIRKAAGAFILGLWEERKEGLKAVWSGLRANKKKRAANIAEDEMSNYLDWKSLAAVLLYTSKSLDDDSSEQPSALKSALFIPSLSNTQMTRATAAVESIGAEHELWKDWESLVDYLLVDHSTNEEDMWLLREDEETFMLQVLLACIEREENEEDEPDRTKTLIKVLPRLFAKHQGDVGRMTGILSIPGHMNLSLYLDMRMSSAYESLWDDISKQFLKYTSPTILTASISAIGHLVANSSLSSINEAKLSELQESLFASLRDAIGSEDVALVTLDDEQISHLEAIMLRITLLQRSMDLVDVMEDEEGQQSSGWDIICAFADRGKLGYKEEATMVDYAVQIIFLHVTWLFKRFSKEDAQDATKVDLLCTRRDTALQTFSPLFLGETTNTANAVRRQAFISFINTHVLFAKRAEGRGGAPASDVCSVAVPDEIQHRLGGAFQAAIERYASVMETRSAGQEESQQPRELTPDEIQEDLHFFQLVSVFVGAIRCGVLEVEHAKEPLAHYSRFGPTYDSIVKKLVDVLRDEGIYNREADAVQHVAGSALQQSFNIFLDSEEDEPTAPLALARVIATAFVIHGSQFAILRQLHPSDVCDFHLEALDFVSRKFSTTVKQEGNARNKEQKSRLTRKKWAVLTFFKVLVPLLGPVTGKGALKIKAHLEDVIDSSGVQLTTNKGWDGYRAYEKRLIGIASKDPNVKMMASKKVVEREDTEG